MANHTDWLNISSMRGSSGQTRLTITARTNPDEIDKRAIIKVYNPENGASAQTYVTLSSYVPYINVSPSIVGIPGSGGTYQFGIYANCSYVIAYPDMVTSYSSSAGTGNTNITFTVPSTSADTTLVGNIVLTDTSGQYSTIVRLEQYGSGVSITYSPSAVTIPFSGGSATFTVTANCVYSVNKGSGTWYSVSSNSGYTGETVFTICANTVNTGNTNWTSSIDIVGPSGSVGTVSVTQENQGSTRINYTADTSTIAASGEVRTITIDATDFINSSITVTVVDAPEGVTAVYTQSSTTRGLITLTVPDNPGSPRDITVVVTGRRALSTTTASATIAFPQAEHTTVPIPYTADTSTVDASGETRTITIDTTNLVESSITIGIEGATGVSYSYDNGVITVVFPAIQSGINLLDVIVSATTVNGEMAICTVSYVQRNTEGLNEYLTLVFSTSGGAYWATTDSTDIAVEIECKKNDGNWSAFTSTNSGALIAYVSPGDKIYVRGDNPFYCNNKHCYFKTTGTFEIEGNIMSLIDSTNFPNLTAFGPYRSQFEDLFSGCTGLTSAENLIMPVMSLRKSCYQEMFRGCTSLVKAPVLPATTLAESCYSDMFSDCTSLTTAPELPATTLANWCYGYMFLGCTNLTTAPSVLPATTLPTACYESMFSGCTSLTTAPELPATILNTQCCTAMFYNCTSLTTAPSILPATTLAVNCYSFMFYGCTSLTTAPELPATTLANYCYSNMFNGCKSLNYIKCLATNISASSTIDWVQNVASSGIFVKDASMTGWTTGASGIPSGWTVQDGPGPTPQEQPLTFKITSAGTIVWKARISAFTRTIQYSKDSGSTWTSITSSTGGTSIFVNAGDVVQFRGDNATYSSGDTRHNSFSGSTAGFEVEGNIMSLIDSTGYTTATTLASSYTFNNLFSNCTGLTSAENLVLPATTLTNSCYGSMFFACLSLTTAPALPATTLAAGCYYEMFNNCTGLTTAPKLPATTLAERCYKYMFQGCTSLTTAPELPATTLAPGCYSDMFSDCTSLTTAPELPATTLANNCYYAMFYNCTSLNNINCLATDISATNCTNRWVYGVSSAGTFITPSSTNWSTGESGIPSGWTRVDAT